MAVGLILVLAALFAGRISDQASFVDTDGVTFQFPMWRFGWSQITAGHFPWWNPYLFGGVPFAAHPAGSALFYPPNWLFALRRGIAAMELSGIAHLYLAGMGTYILGRSLRLSPLAAAAATLAMVFGQSAMTYFWSGALNMLMTLTWMPWVFWCVWRISRAPNGRTISLGGLIVGLLVLAGNLQLCYEILLGAAVYALYLLWKEVQPWARRRVAASWLGMLLLGFGLSAIQLALTLELVGQTVRGKGLSYLTRAAEPLHPYYLPTLFIPDLWDGATVDIDQIASLLNGTECAWYIGFLPAVMALAAAWVGRRDTAIRFWSFLTALFVTLAMGYWTPIHWVAYKLLPFFSSFRVPGRHLVVASLGLCMLFGYGVDMLLARRIPIRRLLKAVALFASVLFLVSALGSLGRDPLVSHLVVFSKGILSSPRITAMARERGADTAARLGIIPALYDNAVRALAKSTGWGAAAAGAIGLLALSERLYSGRLRVVLAWTLLLGLPLADLLMHLFFVNTQQTEAYRSPAELDAVRKDAASYPGPYRLLIMGREKEDVPVPFQNKDGLGLEERLDLANGYDPLELGIYRDFAGILTGNPDPRSAIWLKWGELKRLDLLALFNVRYVVYRKAQPALERSGWAAVHTGNDDVHIYRNPDTLPRAYTASTVELVKDPARALSRIQGSFDPRVPVIERADRTETGDQAPASLEPAAAGLGQTEIVAYSPNKLEIDVRTQSAGYVILSDIWYPGWRATVNGQPRPVYRANYAFRAVEVAAGTSKVLLFFKPTYFQAGLWTSLLALAAAAILPMAFRGRQRRVVIP